MCVTSGLFGWLWESNMAVQFQVRHLLLSATQAGRHTPSPQHSGLNPNTPSNTSRWERLQSSHFFDDFFSPPLSLCLVPCARPSSVFQMETAHAQLPPNTHRHAHMHAWIPASQMFCSLLILAFRSVSSIFWMQAHPQTQVSLDSGEPGVFNLPSRECHGLQRNWIKARLIG